MAVRTGDGGNNDLFGTGDPDTLSGLAGDDELFGGAQSDQLFGGDGNDTLVGGGDSGDLLSGGNGNDSLQAGDTYIGGAGNDTMDGATSSLDGFEGVYYSDGGSLGVIVNMSASAKTVGGVTVAAGQARDNFGFTDRLIDIEYVLGTARADTFFTAATPGNWYEDLSAVSGGDGNDTINGSAGMALAQYEQDWRSGNAVGIIANLDSVAHAGLAAGTIRDGFGAIDRVISVEAVYATFFDDTLFGGGAEHEIFEGFAGDDRIDGGASHDVAAYNYDATAAGFAAPPGVGSGAGRILVNLSAATATLGGVAVASGTVRDAFGDTDILLRIEEVWGTVQDDIMLAANTNTTFWGNLGHDSLTGGSARDVLNGDVGNDTLTGRDGNDILDAGNGKDRLIGGLGLDTLRGGINADTFVFLGETDSGITRTTRDQVTDFSDASDKFDVSALDANAAQGGNQAFATLITGAFTAAGQIRAEQSGDDVILAFNTDADTGAEMTILVLDALAAEFGLKDFIL
jgi:Ca2+-binding RTX toxin-like protein